MNDEQFHAMVDRIQEQVHEDVRDTYGAKGYERWLNPRFRGELDDADCKGRITGKCGDTMIMFLKVDGDTVTAASYRTDGCGSSNIAGSYAAELAIGKTIERIFDLTGEDVLEKIGCFPKKEEHCAFLAIKTVQEAANNYMVQQSRTRSRSSRPDTTEVKTP